MLQLRADFFVAQRLTRFNLRQALVNPGEKPSVMIDQALDGFDDQEGLVAALLLGEVCELRLSWTSILRA